MCNYAYPYPVNNNEGFTGWWAIFIVIIVIFFLFWGFNPNNNR